MFPQRCRANIFIEKKKEFKKRMLLNTASSLPKVTSSGQVKYDRTLGKFVFMEKLKPDNMRMLKAGNMKKQIEWKKQQKARMIRMRNEHIEPKS